MSHGKGKRRWRTEEGSGAMLDSTLSFLGYVETVKEEWSIDGHGCGTERYARHMSRL